MTRRPRKPLPTKRGLSANLIITLVVVALAILIIGGALLANRSSSGEKGGPSRISEQLLRRPDSHTLTTAPDGKVTLVEFLDLQCPACARFYGNITKKLEQDYRGRITFVTRNFPLDNAHPLAVLAAQAAEAAGMQGKYSEMYHALYDNYESWAVSGDNVSNNEARAREQFDSYARQIGLDLNRFHQDMKSAQVTKRIDNDRSDGRKAGVTGTPTFFINGERFEPKGQTYADVDKQLRHELDADLKK